MKILVTLEVSAAAFVLGCAGIKALSLRERFPLVRDGVAAPIVVPDDAEASTHLAAREIADYVEKVSGVRPAILTNDYTRVPRVEIGTLDRMPWLPKSVVDRFSQSDSWESHVAEADGEVLRIVGRDEVAELYGAYQFLEEKIGVRWFKQRMPEDDGEYVPSAKELLIPAYSKFRAPFFLFRKLSQTGSSVGYVPVDGIAWTVRNGLQTSPYRDGLQLFKPTFKETKPGTHRLHWETMKPRVQRRKMLLGGGHLQYFPILRADKGAHPEYLPEIGGVRTNWPGRACQSNPEVQKLLAEDIIGRFTESGGRGTYLFGEMDGALGYCECAACRALDTPEEKAKGLNRDISTRFCTGARKVADMVYAKFPDVMLINWAYSVYRNPPTGVNLDPRTGVEFCIHGRCYGHPLDDPNCERNPKMLDWIQRWMKCAKWLKLYEYAHCSGIWYAPEETVLADDLRLYKKIGVRGWGEEMHYADSVHVPIIPKDKFDSRREYTLSHWQWIYLAGKMTWDPDLDEKEILDDAESKYYGAAYPEMKEYHAYRRRIWRNGPVCFAYGGYPMKDERTRTLMSIPGAKEKLLGWLDRAEKLVQDDPKRLYRVRQDRTWLQRYWIEPNEKLRKTADPTLRAVETANPPVVDGGADDLCWTAAKWMEGATPERVSAAAVTDYKKLYFLFRVTGSSGVVKGDRLGVVLYAPDSDNTGKSYSFQCDLGKLAKGTDYGYTAELAVDTSAIRPLKRGEIWRVRFFRNPDGNEPDIRYPMEIGEPKLANGSFECLGDAGTPRQWDGIKKDGVVTYDGCQHAIRVTGHFCQGLSGLRSFGTSKVDRKVRISFRAWGHGKLSLWFLRYRDTMKPNGGTDRKIMSPNISIGVPDVTEKPKYFSFTATIPAGEWMSLYFRRAWEKKMEGDLLVDDVSLTDEE